MENNNILENTIIKHNGSEFFIDTLELDKFNKKLIFQTFIKSYIWLVIPACLIVFMLCLDNYSVSKGNLTPYSIHVDSYYRSDGTFVSAYNRRPPGGVAHDEPLKRTMFWTMLTMAICAVVSLLSVLICISTISNRIQVTLFNLERDVLKRNKKVSIDNAIISAKIDFHAICNLPRGLKFGKNHRCKFCKSYISENNLCIFFKAKIHTHYVCSGCIKQRSVFGRNQKITDFQEELAHINRVEFEFSKFRKALESSVVGNVSFSIQEIRAVFREFLIEAGTGSLKTDEIVNRENA